MQCTSDVRALYEWQAICNAGILPANAVDLIAQTPDNVPIDWGLITWGVPSGASTDGSEYVKTIWGTPTAPLPASVDIQHLSKGTWQGQLLPALLPTAVQALPSDSATYATMQVLLQSTLLEWMERAKFTHQPLLPNAAAMLMVMDSILDQTGAARSPLNQPQAGPPTASEPAAAPLDQQHQDDMYSLAAPQNSSKLESHSQSPLSFVALPDQADIVGMSYSRRLQRLGPTGLFNYPTAKFPSIKENRIGFSTFKVSWSSNFSRQIWPLPTGYFRAGFMRAPIFKPSSCCIVGPPLEGGKTRRLPHGMLLLHSQNRIRDLYKVVLALLVPLRALGFQLQSLPLESTLHALPPGLVTNACLAISICPRRLRTIYALR